MIMGLRYLLDGSIKVVLWFNYDRFLPQSTPRTHKVHKELFRVCHPGRIFAVA
jgi:hypothetical protein